MQLDFHYYATYCAAFLAGYTHEECMDICYSAQFVDECSRALLSKIKAPQSAATTQLQLELMDARTDTAGRQDITRIWSSFHFLPGDLYAECKRGPKVYKNKYRLICRPNGDLLVDTVNLAKEKTLQAAGIAMHVLADTWAHTYFAGTPSLVINNTNYHFYELKPDGRGGFDEVLIKFNNNPMSADEPESSYYTNSLFTPDENSIMNLGHGRAGHLPDYSYVRYKYLPAWGDYDEIIKDNPSDYLHAFTQMIYALKYLRGLHDTFEKEKYDAEAVRPFRYELRDILLKRQIDAREDWKALGERLSGCRIDDFDVTRYQQEYMDAAKDARDDTFLGRFIIAALAQKSMVSGKIYKSGNRLAGISVDYNKKGFRGNKDFRALVRDAGKNEGSGEAGNGGLL